MHGNSYGGCATGLLLAYTFDPERMDSTTSVRPARKLLVYRKHT